MEWLRGVDPEIAAAVEGEARRQQTTLMMIASENHPSFAVEEAVGSKLGSKYSEGYPSRRFYQGQQYADKVEATAIDRAKKLFRVPYVNVQPYSGSPANLEVLIALLKPRDTIMGLSLDSGGHLTHGATASQTSKLFNSVQYGVTEEGLIDYDNLERYAKVYLPRIIIAGTTAYSRVLDWERFADIAKRTNAILMADIAHVAGLIVGDAYPSPVPYVDVVTTTTHKTLRGPRGAMIMVTEQGLSKDPEMAKKIDSIVFPGLQGGPHMNSIAGIAVALQEASTPQFKEYAAQVVKNAQMLARRLREHNFDIITGGTDSHLILIDLRSRGILGRTVAEGLERAGIDVNRNATPDDPNPPFYPSGLRLGTAAITSRGMKEREMKIIADCIGAVVSNLASSKRSLKLGDDFEKRSAKREEVINHASGTILAVKDQTLQLCEGFPIPKTYA